MQMVFIRWSAFLIFLFLVNGLEAFPITVKNCGEDLVFEAPPERAVIHDINMAEMAFALELQNRIVGLSGITGWYIPSADFNKKRGNIPEIAPKEPTIESLLAVSPDFLFAGWYYGLEPGGEITPKSLEPFGVKTLLLSESCIHLDKVAAPADMNLLYGDVLRLGKIFDQEKKAQILVESWKQQVARIKKNNSAEKPLIFLYDSGEEKPFTAGKYAIITAMIREAGGKNIFEDFDTSWGYVSWEHVASRNPEFLILLDYQTANNAGKLLRFLQSHPAMKEIEAVKQEKYVTLRYEEITPGPNNIGAIGKIAKMLQAENFVAQ